MNAVKSAASTLTMASILSLAYGTFSYTYDGSEPYVSGGVGEGEPTELNTLSNSFNLRLQFAILGSGEYLSAVRRSFLDAQRQTAHINGSRQSRLDFTGVESGHIAFEARSTADQNALHFKILQHLRALRPDASFPASCRIIDSEQE